MIQYDLTQTPLFNATTGVKAPNDAELFVVTAALLLVNEASYSELGRSEIALSSDNVESVAACIEKRLPEFARDVQVHATLRRRLADLVGMRIYRL